MSKSIKIIFINPFPYYAEGINEATIEPPLGIAYLAAYARQHGIGAKIIDTNVLRILPAEAARQSLGQDAGLIGISTNIVTQRAGMETARYLRNKGYKGIIILGGPYATSLPEACLSENLIDAVVLGEGELTMMAIIDNLRQGKDRPFVGVRGTAWCNNGKIVREAPRELIKDIDSLPSPAYDLLPDLSLYKSRAKRMPVGAVLSSRGCPHQCTYCNNNIFQRRFRAHSVDRILQDIGLLVQKFGVRQIDFLDDNITADIKRAKELFLRLKTYGLAINLQNGVRADHCDEELLKLMKEAGVFKMSIGVETGSPEMQIRIKKRLDLNCVLRTTRLAKQLGMVVYGNFILGFPYDDDKTMESTIKFAIKMDPDVANFMIFVPLPGTEAYEEIQNKGRFLYDDKEGLTSGFYAPEALFEFPGMDTDEVKRYYTLAYRKFYGRPEKILKLLSRIRSFSELKWLCSAVLVILKSLVVKNEKMKRGDIA